MLKTQSRFLRCANVDFYYTASIKSLHEERTKRVAMNIYKKKGPLRGDSGQEEVVSTTIHDHGERLILVTWSAILCIYLAGSEIWFYFQFTLGSPELAKSTKWKSESTRLSLKTIFLNFLWLNRTLGSCMWRISLSEYVQLRFPFRRQSSSSLKQKKKWKTNEFFKNVTCSFVLIMSCCYQRWNSSVPVNGNLHKKRLEFHTFLNSMDSQIRRRQHARLVNIWRALFIWFHSRGPLKWKKTTLMREIKISRRKINSSFLGEFLLILWFVVLIHLSKGRKRIFRLGILFWKLKRIHAFSISSEHFLTSELASKIKVMLSGMLPTWR